MAPAREVTTALRIRAGAYHSMIIDSWLDSDGVFDPPESNEMCEHIGLLLCMSGMMIPALPRRTGLYRDPDWT
jgi:hypothetical protein